MFGSLEHFSLILPGLLNKNWGLESYTPFIYE